MYNKFNIFRDKDTMNDRDAAKELIKIAKELESYEFPNKKELVKYLHEHPAAKPSRHTVKRTPKRNRLPDQLRNPDKDRHEEYGKLEHADLDKEKVKKIRKRLKNLKERAQKVDEKAKGKDKAEVKEAPKKEAPKKEEPKKEAPKKEAPKKEDSKKKEAPRLQAPPVEDVTPKIPSPDSEDKPKSDRKEKGNYTRSKNKHVVNYSKYNFDADPDKKESPWKNMDWKTYTKYAKQATHIGHALLHEHGFDEEAMNDIRETRKNRFGSKSTLNPQEIKQKYMDNMNLKNFSSPEALRTAKARVGKMTPADFLIVFRSILADEEDEAGVVNNMKNIQNNQQKFMNSPQWSGESAHKTW